MATLLQTLDNPNAYSTSAYDQFGYSTAISGDIAVVGAYREDDAGGTDSGKVYVFSVSTGLLLHTLDNPSAYGTSAGDQFGFSVAISVDTIVVGAPLEDDAGGLSSGKVYVFSASTGLLLHTLDNPSAYGTSAGDQFGYSVAISGDNVVVGAPLEDDAGGTSSGAVYLFSASSGLLTQTLDNPSAYGTSAGDQFGYSVAISGDNVVVGVPFEDDIDGTSSGKVYVFTSAGLYTLDNPNAYGTSANDYFGHSVAISGDNIVVGSIYAADAGGTYAGAAYIFSVSTGLLLHHIPNPNAFGTSGVDYFGCSVDIDGDNVIIGAYLEGDAESTYSGKAYVFSASSGLLLHTLDNPSAYGTSANDYFGYSVAISGTNTIVGAYAEDDAGGLSSGKAYVFALPSTIPAIRGFTSNSVSLDYSLTLTKPSGVVAGDLLLILFSDEYFIGESAPIPGWTALYYEGLEDPVQIGLWKIADGTEAPTETLIYYTSSFLFSAVGYYLRIDNHNPTAPFNITNQSTSVEVPDTVDTATVSGITPTKDSLVFAYLCSAFTTDPVVNITSSSPGWSTTEQISDGSTYSASLSYTTKGVLAGEQSGDFVATWDPVPGSKYIKDYMFSIAGAVPLGPDVTIDTTSIPVTFTVTTPTVNTTSSVGIPVLSNTITLTVNSPVVDISKHEIVNVATNTMVLEVNGPEIKTDMNFEVFSIPATLSVNTPVVEAEINISFVVSTNTILTQVNPVFVDTTIRVDALVFANTITLTVNSPEIEVDMNFEVASGSATLIVNSPTVAIPVDVVVGSSELVITLNSVVVTTGVTVSPDSIIIITQVNTPVVIGHASVPVSSNTLTFNVQNVIIPTIRLDYVGCVQVVLSIDIDSIILKIVEEQIVLDSPKDNIDLNIDC